MTRAGLEIVRARLHAPETASDHRREPLPSRVPAPAPARARLGADRENHVLIVARPGCESIDQGICSSLGIGGRAWVAKSFAVARASSGRPVIGAIAVMQVLGTLDAGLKTPEKPQRFPLGLHVGGAQRAPRPRA